MLRLLNIRTSFWVAIRFTWITEYFQIEIILEKRGAFDHLGNVQQFKGIRKQLPLHCAKQFEAFSLFNDLSFSFFKKKRLAKRDLIEKQQNNCFYLLGSFCVSQTHLSLCRVWRRITFSIPCWNKKEKSLNSHHSRCKLPPAYEEKAPVKSLADMSDSEKDIWLVTNRQMCLSS